MFIYGDFSLFVYTATKCLIKYKITQNFNIYHFATINILTLHFSCSGFKIEISINKESFLKSVKSCLLQNLSAFKLLYFYLFAAPIMTLSN